MFVKTELTTLLAWLLIVVSTPAQSVELPDGFVDEVYISGLTGLPTGFEQSADGWMFISEKSGIVRVARDGVLLEKPFLDINEIVNDYVDRGLLSIAVHPQFPATPYVYVLYTYDPPELLTNGHTGYGLPDGEGNRVGRLVRYTANAERGFNEALLASARIILGSNSNYEAIGEPEGQYDTLTPSCGAIDAPMRDCLPVDELSHTIGAVRFASDGTLLVSNGDGASYHNIVDMTVMAHDVNSMRGKILRIDPETGDGLPDNPFYDNTDPGSNQSKVLSSGLRNPYSMTVHPLTGVPYVGDVGWHEWEEINGGTGRDFGWPCYSGSPGNNSRHPDFEDLEYCQTLYDSGEQYTPPLLGWRQNQDGAASMVGDFYFGETFPSHYTGMLFYGDFVQGWIHYASVNNPAKVVSYDFASGLLPMTEIRTGQDGSLYYASITTGEIRRIRFEADTTSTTDSAIENNDSVGDSSGVNSEVDGTTDVDTESDGVIRVGAVSPLWLVSLLLFGLYTRRRLFAAH
ncbi:MAG: PQQ-dependent sugar dehydrogenase [Granulosicoccus sp.]